MKSTPEFKQNYLKEFSYLNQECDGWKYTREEYHDLIFNRIDKIFAPLEHLDNNQNIALQNIYQSMQAIDNTLAPLRVEGIPYSLASTGGSLYDFLTGNCDKTKDIDLVLYFAIAKNPDDNKDEPEKNEPPQEDSNDLYAGDWTGKTTKEKNNKILKKYQESVHKLIREHAPQLAHNPNDYDMEIFSHFVKTLINKNYLTPNIYTQKNFDEGDYVKVLLHGLIKIEDLKLPKPVDIMIAQRNIQTYCDSFDFNICKNYLIYRNDNQVHNANSDLVTDIENKGYCSQLILDHMRCFPNALKDIENKTYTMKLNELRLSDIDYYMTRHYPRMKEKLPDYELNFSCQPETQHIANAYIAEHRYEKLQNKIPHKDDALILKKKI